MNALFQRLTGLTLLDPGWLACAVLVPLALSWRRRRGGPAVAFAPALLFRRGEGRQDPLPRSWRNWCLPLPWTLQALGLLCVVVALARPAQRVRLPAEVEGIDILLCLDTSSSMTANDMDRRRTRLALAKEAADRFIRGRPDDRIGLIGFARFPDVRCPLTLDHDALIEILDDLGTVQGEGPEDATGIGTAVARAAQVLHAAGAESKVLILLTDGEENVAVQGTPGEIAPTHAAQLCEQLGVRVYAIVAGTGRPDPTGAWRKPDTRAVEQMANRTGGAFLEADDAAAMAAVYARIDEMERVPIAEPEHTYRDFFLSFLIAAFSLIVAGRLLASTLLQVLP
ncbi:MAG: vWA domain-containing protein [Planctomycetota bacterium]